MKVIETEDGEMKRGVRGVVVEVRCVIGVGEGVFTTFVDFSRLATRSR